MNNTEPLVSVTVCTYNTGELLHKTIESVLSQTYTNIELIIVDDASTDNTPEIIKSYDDPRIKAFYHNANQHVCITANEAFSHCTGKYIALIGHDDLWDPTKIEKQVEYLEANPEMVACFTGAHTINENGDITDQQCEEMVGGFYVDLSAEDWILTLISTGNRFCAPSALIRKGALEAVGYYRLGLVQTQDYELWIRLLTQGNFHTLEEPLTYYRRFSKNGINLSSSIPEVIAREHHEIQYVKYDAIIRMEDSLFLKVFKQLLHGSPSTPNQVLCEKACTLITLENAFANMVMMNILDIDECREYLENTCNFCVTDFYKFNTAPVKFDNIYYDLCLQQNELIKQLSGQ